MGPDTCRPFPAKRAFGVLFAFGVVWEVLGAGLAGRVLEAVALSLPGETVFLDAAGFTADAALAVGDVFRELEGVETVLDAAGESGFAEAALAAFFFGAAVRSSFFVLAAPSRLAVGVFLPGEAVLTDRGGLETAWLLERERRV